MSAKPESTVTLRPGERVVRCLCGQETDRVPFGVGLGWHAWGETHERWRKETGNPKLDLAAALGYEPSFALPALRSGPWPEFAREKIEETNDYYIYRNERGIVAKQLKGTSAMPDWLEYPVKRRSDWDKLRAERYRLGDSTRVAENWTAFRERLGKSGEAVQVGSFPWGVFGTIRDLLGAEETLVAFYDDPEMIHDMMEHLTSIWIGMWEEVARHVQIDHIHIWEDMSGKQGSLISPAMVEEFMMPCYDRIADFGRRHKVRVVSVDTDGECSELVPIFMKHGINMMFPFEVQAGNDIREYRKKYPRLGIMGGLDKRALARDRSAIDLEVEKAAWMVANGGRYIPGFDHLIPPDVSWENMKYVSERIREVCFGRG